MLQRRLLDANCEITVPVMFMEIKAKLNIFSKEGKKKKLQQETIIIRSDIT